MTYLQLVQSLCAELGLSGGGGATAVPASVTGNTILELGNACRWIHDACLDIDTQWLDWKYLWQQYSAPGVAANQQSLPVPTLPTGVIVRQWDRKRFRWRQTSVGGLTWGPVRYVDRLKFLRQCDPDNAVPNPPSAFTIQPNNTVFFSAPFDQAYDFLGEYWQRPTELINNGDVPMMPFEHHRIIMCRAAVMYGNREDAPEIISGLEAEYIDRLDKLQGDQLEDWDIKRNSTDRDPLPDHDHLGGWGFSSEQ